MPNILRVDVGTGGDDAPAILQPGNASLHLHLAGAWATAVLSRQGLVRTATSSLVPETFEAFSAAMSTSIAFFLAVEHARVVVRGAPWMGSQPMADSVLDDLHARGLEFRDFYMHVEDKDQRPHAAMEAAADRQATSGAAAQAPFGYVSMGFGFNDGPWLLAPSGRRSTGREMTRISWNEIEQGATAIRTWVAKLLNSWADVSDRWALYIESHRYRLGSNG